MSDCKDRGRFRKVRGLESSPWPPERNAERGFPRRNLAPRASSATLRRRLDAVQGHCYLKSLGNSKASNRKCGRQRRNEGVWRGGQGINTIPQVAWSPKRGRRNERFQKAKLPSGQKHRLASVCMIVGRTADVTADELTRKVESMRVAVLTSKGVFRSKLDPGQPSFVHSRSRLRWRWLADTRAGLCRCDGRLRRLFRASLSVRPFHM